MVPEWFNHAAVAKSLTPTVLGEDRAIDIPDELTRGEVTMEQWEEFGYVEAPLFKWLYNGIIIGEHHELEIEKLMAESKKTETTRLGQFDNIHGTAFQGNLSMHTREQRQPSCRDYLHCRTTRPFFKLLDSQNAQTCG